jgi:hypothetical protein
LDDLFVLILLGGWMFKEGMEVNMESSMKESAIVVDFNRKDCLSGANACPRFQEVEHRQKAVNIMVVLIVKSE